MILGRVAQVITWATRCRRIIKNEKRREEKLEGGKRVVKKAVVAGVLWGK